MDFSSISLLLSMNRNFNHNLQLAGFTDLEGHLKAYISGASRILVPPAVEIAEYNIEGKENSFIYPMPERAYKCGPLTVMHLWGPNLFEEMGWKWNNNTDGLLDDLIGIINKPPEHLGEFVLKWGPLWICAKHSNPDHYCYFDFSFHQLFGKSDIDELCGWLPAEPIAEFYRRANEIKAALEIAMYLKENKLPPVEVLKELEFDTEYGCPITYRELLAGRITDNLSFGAGPYFSLNWKANGSPNLTLNSGFGFFHLAWLQLAQLISSSNGPYFCHGCGKPYVREKRKPAKGRSNYCPTCGPKAAKRNWARKNK